MTTKDYVAVESEVDCFRRLVDFVEVLILRGVSCANFFWNSYAEMVIYIYIRANPTRWLFMCESSCFFFVMLVSTGGRGVRSSCIGLRLMLPEIDILQSQVSV